MYARIQPDQTIPRLQIVKVKLIRDEDCDILFVEYNDGIIADIGIVRHDGQLEAEINVNEFNPFKEDDRNFKKNFNGAQRKITIATLFHQLNNITHTMATTQQLNDSIKIVSDGLAKLATDLATLQGKTQTNGNAIMPSDLDAPIAALNLIGQGLASLDTTVVAETPADPDPNAPTS